MNDPDWPFDDSPNTASFTTSKVLGGHPILLVTHDEDDGNWQFFCGSTSDSNDIRIVGLGSMVKRDDSLTVLADLPLGWCAWRKSPDDFWQREPDHRHGED